MLSLAIVNGPNLNLIGKREPEIYGTASLDEFLEDLKTEYPDIRFSFFQSNVEGELINFLQQCVGHTDGIILNAGGYSHTSVALADTLASLGIPAVEVHISNIWAREGFRHNGLVAAKCKGSIAGLGLEGYKLAVQFFVSPQKSRTAV